MKSLIQLGFLIQPTTQNFPHTIYFPRPMDIKSLIPLVFTIFMIYESRSNGDMQQNKAYMRVWCIS